MFFIPSDPPSSQVMQINYNNCSAPLRANPNLLHQDSETVSPVALDALACLEKMLITTQLLQETKVGVTLHRLAAKNTMNRP